MADSSLGAVAELLKLFTGKGNTTTTKDFSDGFTETTQKGLPPEAMQALIKTAMEGSQGLASVAGGQKSAGLYNSSTNQLLVNDLLARITGQAATLGAPTTVTRSPTSRTQTQSVQSPALKNSMPALAGMSLAKGGIDQLLGYGSKAHSLYSRGKDLFDWFAASESSIPGGAISAANATADPIGSLYTLTSGFSDAAPSAGAALSSISSPAGISGLDFAESISSLFSYPSVEAVNAGGELAFMSADTGANSLSELARFDALNERGITATGDAVRSFRASLENPRLPSFSEYLSSPDAIYLRDSGATVDQLLSNYGVPLTAAEQGIAAGVSSLFAPTSSESFIDAYGLGGGMTEAYGAGSTLYSPTASEAWIDAGGLASDVGSSMFLTGPAAEAGSSLFAATATEAAIDAGALGGAAAAETAGASGLFSALGPAGLVMNAGTILPAFGKVVTGWVICTELNSTGELSDTLYQATSPHFSRMHPDTIRGYQWWAIPYVKLMRKHSIFRGVVRPWAIGRARYLSGETSFLGYLTVKIGEPICFLLGKTVARKSQDYEVLYGR